MLFSALFVSYCLLYLSLFLSLFSSLIFLSPFCLLTFFFFFFFFQAEDGIRDHCVTGVQTCALPISIDAAITGAADKDRACMKALLMPEARMVIVSLGADGAPSYTLLTLDDWIARTKARGHAMLEEKQLKFHVERYGNIAHLWSSYALHSDGKQVARGINSIQAIKVADGWRVMVIMAQAEAATAPLPKEYLP